MSAPAEAALEAGDAIDALLGADDGKLLAELARARANLARLVPPEAFVGMLQRAVDAAPTVRWLDHRARTSINPARPQAMLLVDDWEAAAHHEAVRRAHGERPDLGYGGDWRAGGRENAALKRQCDRIVQLKAWVVGEEVIRPVTDEINGALRRHWDAARARVIRDGTSEELARMILSSIFSVGAATGNARVHSRQKAVVLSALL